MDITSKNVLKFKGTSLSYVDYVLVYKNNDFENDAEKSKSEENSRQRKLFTNKLEEKGLIVEEINDKRNQQTFVLIQSSLSRLCNEAERIGLRMPINSKTDYDEVVGCCKGLEDYFVTDNEDDFLSAAFHNSLKYIYKDHDRGDKFFRPGLRFFMTFNILINNDISEDYYEGSEKAKHTKALHHLTREGVYSAHFVPHSPSKLSKYFQSLVNIQKEKTKVDGKKRKKYIIDPDEREDLHKEWIIKWRYQPLWKIRNYFGEKSAFYFAWTGHMIICLWAPIICGLVVFLYGLYLSITQVTVLNINNATSELNKVEIVVENMLNTIKKSFDNILTPIFAGIICIWGTIFTETWKRLSNKLAFEWDIASFDETEPERPQFIGTDERKDPITNSYVKYFPLKRQSVRYFGSLTILLGMLFIVFGASIAIIVYRVIVTVNVCPGTTSINCLILNLVITSVLNAVAIIVLGKVYDKVAVVLTNWENHRTQSLYDNALILKLFVFQFINSYSSLFYIAFFKGKSSGIQNNGIFNMGLQYIDTCGVDNSCMSMLSFQVLTLMIIKPLPKLLTDVVLPFILEKINLCKKTQTVSPDKRNKHCLNIKYYLLDELSKPALGDFTISEYMEKVLQYGYLVLFAASFPLAPLFAFLTNVFDAKVDANRLLWMYRRPVPEIVQDIGIWQSIVETLNLLGVVSTAFIIAFTSSWGLTLSLENKLIFVIVAEHGLLLIKYILNVLIPDVPESVKINMRREKFHLNKQKETILD